MPNKQVQCNVCQQIMRSDHIKRHMNIHIPECNNTSSTHDVHDTYVWKMNDVATKKNHSFLLPRDIRGIIVGKSGFGKTTILNYMLLEPDVLDYDTLIVCGNSLHQPEYKIMNAAFTKKLSKNQIKGIFEHQNEAMEEGGPENVIENVREGMCKGNINAVLYRRFSNTGSNRARSCTEEFIYSG